MATNRSSLSRLLRKPSPRIQTEASGATPSQGGECNQSLQVLDDNTLHEWDTPLDDLGGSSSYYYEPQGELLQERQRQRSVQPDFSIPQAVGDVGSNWHFPGTDPDSDDNNASERTERPPGAVGLSAGVKRKASAGREQLGAEHQPDSKRPGRVMSDLPNAPDPPAGERPPTHGTRSQGGLLARARSGTDTSGARPRASVSTGPGTSGAPRRAQTDPSTRAVLPARKVFPIQIGDKLFRLSGASISSDAPSYFSQFFEEQLHQTEGADSVRTLYIDRDPATFEDISLHLQGYHVEPRDGPHFVKLFADAQFFSLPRLTAQLFASTIYIRIGDSEFQVPRDLFSNPGDSPNYFSLGFAVFFTTPTEVFPGLTQRTLLRPPSILPPSVPNRSARTFADLLHILKGYPVEVRNDEHRTELLRDARYFHLKGLEQRLIPHKISYNLARKNTEIVIRLEDIRQSGVVFVSDGAGASSSSSSAANTPNGPGWVFYQRPYVDPEAYSLIVDIGGDEGTFLSIGPGSSFSPARVGRASFHRQTLSRIASLFSVIANKINLPVTQPLGLMMMDRSAGVASVPVSPETTGLSEERVKVRIGSDADVTVDGIKWLVGEEDEDDDDGSGMEVDPSESSRAQRKRRRVHAVEDEGEDWVVRRAQWRLRVQPAQPGAQGGKGGMEIILGAVKIDAVSSERGRNTARGFLT
ncbi:hypothetical protein LTR08_000121 [Meristemomyces frigidus]|nr:hypothetical protein LTR08_000121 [Meristemomyces frigidus]